MKESLKLWQKRADKQLNDMGGIPNYIYYKKQVFNDLEVQAILDKKNKLSFGAGQMKHEGLDLGRRNVECATFEEKDILIRMNILPCNPNFMPYDYAIWNYYPIGGFITWHEDTEPGDPRVFTVILLLKEAEGGGELQLNGYETIPIMPGEVIVFPAHVFHRVSPIIKGERESLTLWVCNKNILENT